jgi:tricorn protease
MRSPVCLVPSEYRGGLRADLMHCIDTSRVEFEVQPPQEWRQLLLETWRRARDNFWTGTMNGLNWDHIKAKYLPLIDRIATRSELTEVIYQLQV